MGAQGRTCAACGAPLALTDKSCVACRAPVAPTASPLAHPMVPAPSAWIPPAAPRTAAAHRSSRWPALLAVVIVVALVGGVLVVLHPFSGSGGSSTAHGAAPGTAARRGTTLPGTTTAPDPNRAVPTAWLLTPAELQQGLAKPDTQSTWSPAFLHTMSGADLISGCAPKGRPLTGVSQQYGYADAAGGLHGQARVVLLRFASEAEAQAALAERTTLDYPQCLLDANNRELTTQLGAALEPVRGTSLDPAATGLAFRTSGVYPAPGGRSCAEFIDDYMEQVGQYLMLINFDTCNQPWDEAAERSTVNVMVNRMMRATS